MYIKLLLTDGYNVESYVPVDIMQYKPQTYNQLICFCKYCNMILKIYSSRQHGSHKIELTYDNPYN